MGKAKRPNKKSLQILKKGDTFLKGKRQAIYILIALMFLGLIGGMIAYLADAETAVNEMSVGKNEIEIEEDFDPPDEIPPGASFPKKVQIRNVGKGNCYVRTKVLFSRSDMEELATIDWNTQDWTYNRQDGYYYYRDPLAENALSEPLMNEVSISASADPAQLASFDIIVYAESVQCGNFTDYQDAWSDFMKNIN